MTEARLQALGVGLTVAIHVGVAGVVWGMNRYEQSHAEKKAKRDNAPVAIEAGLAIKKKSKAGKKSKLPQKDVTQKVKPPDAPGIATNPDVVPDPDKPRKDKPDYVPPELRDPSSVFDKYRNKPTVGDPTTVGAGGGDDENREGKDDGSEWGTLAEAKGDPYVGELVGRLKQNWIVPTLVTDEGLVAQGCVRLDETGKIVDREVPAEYKSRDRTFNRAVELALKESSDMDKPVPAHLEDLLTVKGICVKFTP